MKVTQTEIDKQHFNNELAQKNIAIHEDTADGILQGAKIVGPLAIALVVFLVYILFMH
ncbi:hypothetical protein LFL96_26150 [Paraburkholderia sp. D15]|uniref:hypothetical protein n=1 Tax=Paraburkholderia sp. D15 TaxID=2880218 RepID=UPI00247A7595|nr:hypothetical protein [Paraburkholderia sp. D15]WGS54494.1 hypothetical protein LFL96_26150 [Paraburkholderia sp. D15]